MATRYVPRNVTRIRSLAGRFGSGNNGDMTPEQLSDGEDLDGGLRRTIMEIPISQVPEAARRTGDFTFLVGDYYDRDGRPKHEVEPWQEKWVDMGLM